MGSYQNDIDCYFVLGYADEEDHHNAILDAHLAAGESEGDPSDGGVHPVHMGGNPQSPNGGGGGGGGSRSGHQLNLFSDCFCLPT